MPEPFTTQWREFIEECALLSEKFSFSRMHGRIVACLVLAPQPHLSSGELCALLSVTKGALSKELRIMVDEKILKKVLIPGQRSDYYTLSEHLWANRLSVLLPPLQASVDMIVRAKQMVDESARPVNLEHLVEMYAYFKWRNEMQCRMIEDWQDRRPQIIAETRAYFKSL
ncbi:hypothetical protein [Sporomusa sp.]|uniref:GbsR/MarR family transcriptional regulator n=1 Tax=Sporomusa sp. TaxID=2078658 RepID=UPI002BE65A33|nr:hypothetical protein [Sporomusa sp.]HWR44191.1 hypothetical protein [Sporomusa sp.]